LPPALVLYPAPYGSEIPLEFEVIKPDNVDRLQQVYMLGQGNLNKVSWSPDQIHFSMVGDYGAYLYSSKTWDLLVHVPSAYMLEGENIQWNDISPVADFSFDGKYFAVASSNGVLIFDVTTQEQVFELPAEEQYRDITFFHSMERFATCTLGGKVMVYDLKSKQLITEFQVEAEETPDCQRLSVSTDDSRLVWVSGGKIHNWNFTTDEVGKNPEFGYIMALVISADGSKIAATSYTNNTSYTSIWNSTSGIPVTRMSGQLISDYSPVTDQLATYTHATALFTQMCNGPVSVWNFSDFKLTREIMGSMGYSRVNFSPSGKFVTASIEGCPGYKEYSVFRAIRSWDLATGNVVAEYPGILKEGWPANAMVDHPSGAISYDLNDSLQVLGLTSVPSSGTSSLAEVTLWSGANEAPIIPVKPADPTELTPPLPFQFTPSDIDWTKWHENKDIVSPNDRYFASFGNVNGNYKYRITDKLDNTVILEFNRGTGAFTPDSKLFVFFSDDNYQNVTWLEVWDLETKERLRNIRMYIGDLQEVSFTADGRLMQTKSYDQTVRWWAVLPKE